MPIFETWDVIKVPFPYTDRPVRQRRPALVVAASGLESEHGLLWVLMITSAKNRRWAEDVPISRADKAGLPAPSVVRCAKVATIEAQEAERIGKLPTLERDLVSARVTAFLGPFLNAYRKQTRPT
jgi:mRNA interferase MazF